MFFLVGAIGTLLSTFMAADTLSQTFGFHHANIGKFMLFVWISAVFMAPWMSSIEMLGCLHCVAFVSAAARFGEAGLSYDFVRIPLLTFVPTFGILNILLNYAWPTACE
ncbi:hypothetical protein TcCL_ESM07469 [Trypanosoma cruzi]|uniref:Uncharacterized protein n=1 Tax=Trypanosoma cruzi (strain CL Brener) TaxID=353153 RepID=Q4D834_TRYCC|nr:hypothetical protein, conserved [Trypanosoma cruzi]EAN88682.1 hypothetical protein, conserved [Trypanosoma cruzi]RNC55059.1 hypothetical protein TcCL_ESM07469 [Trypanosoma cruzi]|eukprot:XP_810533.1 hypothetical protein [Trypanosoma cruzi strain CL Brener]